MNRRSIACLAAALLAGVAIPAVAVAQDIQERTIRMSTANNKGHPQVMGAERFAELVAEKSGGKIEVKLFAGGTLGNDVTMISALQGGTLEMTVPDTSTLVNIDGLQPFGLINLPFLLESGEQADALLDGPFGEKLLAKLPDKGLVGLGFWENGFRQVTNSRRAIATAEDFSGLKLRVIQNPLFIETFSALGASAQPMPFPEVYTALETGVVDGQENPLATILASKFYEVQDYTVMSNHIYSVWALLMGKKFWDKLSPDEQQLITAAAKEATAFERETIRAFATEARAELESEGMEITELPEAEVAKLREMTKPVWDQFTQQFGQAEAEEMLAALR